MNKKTGVRCVDCGKKLPQAQSPEGSGRCLACANERAFRNLMGMEQKAPKSRFHCKICGDENPDNFYPYYLSRCKTCASKASAATAKKKKAENKPEEKRLGWNRMDYIATLAEKAAGIIQQLENGILQSELRKLLDTDKLTCGKAVGKLEAEGKVSRRMERTTHSASYRILWAEPEVEYDKNTGLSLITEGKIRMAYKSGKTDEEIAFSMSVPVEKVRIVLYGTSISPRVTSNELQRKYGKKILNYIKTEVVVDALAVSDGLKINFDIVDKCLTNMEEQGLLTVIVRGKRRFYTMCWDYKTIPGMPGHEPNQLSQ